MAIHIRPTVRRRMSHAASYVVFLAIVVVMAFTADWKLVSRNFFNFTVAQELWPGIILATLNTIWYTVACFVIGTVLAVVFALMKMSRGPFKWFAIGFIELFRGMPALLTIMIMAFAVPMAFKGLRIPPEPVGNGLVGLILVTIAYTAELIRAGIQAVPKGQREAAQSLGMGELRTTLSVILPQAIRIVIPPLTNEFVMLLKDTSLLYIAGATMYSKELTLFAKDGLSTYANATPFIVAGVFYLIITIPLTYMVGILEKRMAVKK